MNLAESFTSREWCIDQELRDLLRRIMAGDKSLWDRYHALTDERVRLMMPERRRR